MAPRTLRTFQVASRLMPLGRLSLEAGVKKAPLRRCLATVSPIEHLGSTMPPNSKARVGNLQTFSLPDRVTGSTGDHALGKAMIDAWRRDGILQVAMTPGETKLAEEAFTASKAFFSKPHAEKAACIDSQSYAGYIASGEEITDGIADYSEIFTATKDLDLAEPRVQMRWPCHGPTPWPDITMKAAMAKYMDQLGQAGERLLQLIECGLGLENSSLTKYTKDGWHHMRILRFPPINRTNGKGKEGRGIGSHTDYGLLVIAAQDEVGGLFVRPPNSDEKFANWEKTTAGLKEDSEGWTYVPPVPGVFTVFPGDMMQYMTDSYLPSTPHKVGLNTRERYAFAYFHEPQFQAVLKPLPSFETGQTSGEGIHYGTHFTNMFMRNYPDRITTQRIIAENRTALLPTSELRTLA